MNAFHTSNTAEKTPDCVLSHHVSVVVVVVVDIVVVVVVVVSRHVDVPIFDGIHVPNPLQKT